MQPYRTLIITPHYAPDLGPSAPIFTALCEELANYGCDVQVVTGFPHYAGLDPRYKKLGRLIEEENKNGVRIIRTYVYSVPKAALWRRLLYLASINIFFTLGAMRVRKPDIVIADAPALWSGLPLLIKSILPGTPFIYVVYDIYPDVLYRLGVVKNEKIIHAIQQMEDYFYRRTAQVSVLSAGFKENLLGKGVQEEKITIIPACVDADFIQPLPHENTLSKQWELAGKFVVLYAGNMGFSQGLEVVVEVAKILQNYPDIVFVFVGDGATKSDLQALVTKDEISNVSFYPFQPREDVPQIYGLADVCLVSLKKDIVAESVPSKTYTIMASGRPVIATVDENTETSQLLHRAGCGLCVAPGDAGALAEAILSLYKNRPLCVQMGDQGRRYVLDHYSKHVASEHYLDLIKRFAGNNSH
jgi:colanic acid biosynthesis glycosyl transferase WcaI